MNVKLLKPSNLSWVFFLSENQKKRKKFKFEINFF